MALSSLPSYCNYVNTPRLFILFLVAISNPRLQQGSVYRIRVLLVGSAFTRVSIRTITAITTRMITSKKIVVGVTNDDDGVGVGVGGGAFFAAMRCCAYCRLFCVT